MTSRNLPRPLRPIQIGVKLQIWLQILEFAVQEILEFILEFAVQEILEFRRFEKYREPLSGAQMSELARARCARRAKLIGKTHVRTPQVRRLLPKRELVRKGSEKTAKSACPRRHAAPIRRPEKTLPTAQPWDRGRVPVGPDLSCLEVTSLLPPQSSDRKPAPQPTLLGRGGAPPLRTYEPATQIAADGYARPRRPVPHVSSRTRGTETQRLPRPPALGGKLHCVTSLKSLP